MDKKLESLKNNIWMTRKARINSSERLLTTEKFIQGINIYYSCFLCTLSIYGLIYQNDKMGIISCIVSIILTISIVYLNSQNFGGRAQQLKVNYISMQKLLFELDNLDKTSIYDLTEYQNKYCELLSNCENHSIYDYYRVQLNQGNIKVISKEGICYYINKLIIYSFTLLVIILPIILIYYIFT